MIYINLARAKSEALVNNTCKLKKLNRVMLNGESNENGIKVLCMSKIQLVVYNQFWVLIG